MVLKCKKGGIMGMNLYWEIVELLESRILPDELKLVLQHRYGIFDDIEIGMDEYDYYEGLADAGIKGANKILKLLEKYEKIRLLIRE